MKVHVRAILDAFFDGIKIAFSDRADELLVCEILTGLNALFNGSGVASVESVGKAVVYVVLTSSVSMR
jgi:hypothetical protein